MSFNSGASQINVPLLAELLAVGIPDTDAREIARTDAFGGQDTKPWMAGLRYAAEVVTGSGVIFDWSALPNPWHIIGPKVAGQGTSGTVSYQRALQDENYSPDLQLAMLTALSVMTQIVGTKANAAQHVNPLHGPSAAQAQAAVNAARGIAPVDAVLARIIRVIITTPGQPMDRRRRDASDYILEWLFDHGRFIRTKYGVLYYFHTTEHRLYTLASQAWISWFHLLTLENPAGKHFAYFMADCNTVAMRQGEELEVVKVSHWDEGTKVLRVSKFDGQVYRLDGQSITLECNGDGPIMFADNTYWDSYNPDYSAAGSVLDWSVSEVANWESESAAYSELFRSWVIASFFTELNPTRPILVFKGEKGSGKSMALRLLMKFMFGSTGDLSGVPDKPDGFTALTSNNHLVCIDNMDDIQRYLRDRLARLATGGNDRARKLYSDNEEIVITYRCWLAITSRTPDTLQRDDLVDRLIILPVKRVEDADRIREGQFIDAVKEKRNQWWGDNLMALNSVVGEMATGGIPNSGGLRMEDYASFGAVVAKAHGRADVWKVALKLARKGQSDFLLEDDIIVAAIETWLGSSLYSGRVYTTSDLYATLRLAHFGGQIPDSTWPKSTRAFGRRLKGITTELVAYLLSQGVTLWSTSLHNNMSYQLIKATGFIKP